MVMQQDLEEYLNQLVKEAITKFSKNCNKLYGLSLVFDESFVSGYVAGSCEQIVGEKYCPENWGLGFPSSNLGDSDCLNELYEQSEDYDGDDFWHEEYQSRVYYSAVATLEKILHSEETSLKDCFLVVWVSDSGLNIRKAKSVVKRLNSNDAYKSFVSYIDGIA